MKLSEKLDNNNFTSLRLLLALLVVFGHYKIFNGTFTPDWPFCYAEAAVDCFFVVSGYLVTGSLDRDTDLKRYLLRRFFRIYPLYIAVVVAQTVILAALAPGDPSDHVGAIVRYFAVNAVFANFLQHDIGGVLTDLTDPSLNASLWTLKIEVAFYIVLPAIMWAVRRYGARILLAIFAGSVVYTLALEQMGYERLAKQLPGQLQFFVLGIAAYLYRDFLPRPNPVGGAILTVAAATLVTLLLEPQPPVLYPLLIAAFVVTAALATPPIHARTDISYGVYLLHAPIIQLSLLFGIYRDDGWGLAATLATVLALALLVERTIERPGIAIGRRLTRTGGRGRTPTKTDRASKTPLTVVVLNDFCYVQGGASKVAIDEAIGLAKAGARVIFLGAVGPPCAALRDAPLSTVCLDQRELLDAARHPLTVLQAIWNVRAARRMREILDELPRTNTVIHLHGYTKALTTSPARVARRRGFRVVCTLHDFFSACPNGAFFDYSSGKPCARRALSLACVSTNCDKRHYAHKLYRIARSAGQIWLGRFPAVIDTFIALSRNSARILAPYLPRQADVHMLGNVIDVDRRPPVRVATNDEILCIGRLDAEKGVRLLAETASREGRRITFVGDGPLRSEIEAMPGMRVTGWLPSAEVQSALEKARCIVFPSLWYETYGLSVAEALARGVPAIVSDVAAPAERIVDGVTGWIFASRDGDHLARCLAYLDDDDRVRQAGAAAYAEFWTKPETPSRHTERLIGIYRAALAL